MGREKKEGKESVSLLNFAGIVLEFCTEKSSDESSPQPGEVTAKSPEENPNRTRKNQKEHRSEAVGGNNEAGDCGGSRTRHFENGHFETTPGKGLHWSCRPPERSKHRTPHRGGCRGSAGVPGRALCPPRHLRCLLARAGGATRAAELPATVLWRPRHKSDCQGGAITRL